LVAGSSAGAHLAATVALTDPTISGAICLGRYFGSADGEDLHGSPLGHLTLVAPPFLVIHGDNDTIIFVTDARERVERLRAVSDSLVVYAELAGAQHSFDVFRSPRMEASIDAVDAFGTISCHR
jgi:acetyl esterase/lipase